MSEARFPTLQDAILDDVFPDVDLALRRGRHIDRDDAAWYALLVDAEVETGSVTDVLEVREMAEERAVERLEAGALGEPLDDRWRVGKIFPRRVVAECRRQAGRRLGLEFVGPAPQHGVVSERRPFVAETPVVSRPCVTDGWPGERRRGAAETVEKACHSLVSTFLAAISRPRRSMQRSGSVSSSPFQSSVSCAWSCSRASTRMSWRSFSLRRILVTSR